MHDTFGIILTFSPRLFHVIANEATHRWDRARSRGGMPKKLFVDVSPVLSGVGIGRRHDIRARAWKVIYEDTFAAEIEIEFVAGQTVEPIRFWIQASKQIIKGPIFQHQHDDVFDHWQSRLSHPSVVPATVAMAEPADSLRKSRRLIKHSPDPGGILLQLFVAVLQIGRAGPKTLCSGTPRQLAVSCVPDVGFEVEDTIKRFNGFLMSRSNALPRCHKSSPSSVLAAKVP